MCWSGEASTALASVGFVGAIYAAYKKEPAPLWVALTYFSLMEALQAFTYTVIDQCDNPANQIATLLGYLHIAFQPFFINALSMHFIDQKIVKKIEIPVYMLCFVSTVIMLIQLYPFVWAGQCLPVRPLCGQVLCSVSGSWHIAWEVPTNGIGNFFATHALPFINSGFVSYVLVAFFLPVFYGSWRFTLYHVMAGPMLAHLTTSNMNEWPAVWCLLSIALLLLVVKTPIRQWMYVRNFPLWRLLIKDDFKQNQ